MLIGNITDVIDQFKTVEELDQLRDYVLYKKQLIDRNKTHNQIIAERQRALTEAIQNRNRDRMPAGDRPGQPPDPAAGEQRARRCS